MTGQFENPLRLVRELKGAPLSCLFALMFARQPVGLSWLMSITAYGQNQVRLALAYLAEMGLAQRNSRFNGWVMTDSVRQLPLMLGLESDENECPLWTLPPTTATTLIVREGKAGQQQQQVSKRVSTVDTRQSTVKAKNLDALHTAGIKGKTAEDLASRGYITPAYIQAHAVYAKERGDTIGLLITRLRDGDPAPKIEPPEESEEYRRRYISGPYAAYFQHDEEEEDV